MALEMKGEYALPVQQAELWRLLNDPDVLAKIIPAATPCAALGEDRYEMGLKLQVGSVSGEYMGSVAISDKQEPAHYVLNIEGQGSIGFMKGSAAFDLERRARAHPCCAMPAARRWAAWSREWGSASFPAWPSSWPDGFSRRWKSTSSKPRARRGTQAPPDSSCRIAVKEWPGTRLSSPGLIVSCQMFSCGQESPQTSAAMFRSFARARFVPDQIRRRPDAAPEGGSKP